MSYEDEVVAVTVGVISSSSSESGWSKVAK